MFGCYSGLKTFEQRGVGFIHTWILIEGCEIRVMAPNPVAS